MKNKKIWPSLHCALTISVIPERFWPESGNTPEWIPAKGMPE